MPRFVYGHEEGGIAVPASIRLAGRRPDRREGIVVSSSSSSRMKAARAALTGLVALALAAVQLVTATPAGAAAPRVLRVGTYRGIPGQFTSIQAAVDHARPGDWILVGPGTYHEHGSRNPDLSAGVLIR